MVTVEDPRLTQIRDICADAGYAGLPSNLVARIRAILGAPSVDAPPQGRRAGTEFTPGHSMNVVERVTPPQGIDRDALVRGVRDWIDEGEFDAEQLADWVLALVNRGA